MRLNPPPAPLLRVWLPPRPPLRRRRWRPQAERARASRRSPHASLPRQQRPQPRPRPRRRPSLEAPLPRRSQPPHGQPLPSFGAAVPQRRRRSRPPTSSRTRAPTASHCVARCQPASSQLSSKAACLSPPTARSPSSPCRTSSRSRNKRRRSARSCERRSRSA